MIYELDKMNSVKSLEEILSVSDDLIDESNVMGLSSVITLHWDRSVNNVSLKHYETIIHALTEAGILTDRANRYIKETIEEMGGVEYDSLYEYKVTINFDKLNKFREQVIRRIDELKGEKPSNNRLDFDLAKAILYINEHEVKLQKFSDQFHLLEIMFENKERIYDEWFFSEIAENYDDANKKLPDKKFYNASYQLNKNIAVEAGIKDFFTLTNQSVQINR